MIRTNVMLTKSQVAALAHLVKTDPAGTSQSQMLRQFIADGIAAKVASKIGK
jgi:hypothetical protein